MMIYRRTTLLLLLVPSCSLVARTATAFGISSSLSTLNRLRSSTTERPAATVAVAVNGQDTATAEVSSNNLPSIRLNVNEKARTVTSVCTSGTLCTISTHDGIDGAPFGSFVDYILDDSGNPIFLMNEMSMHTVNIQSNPVVSLFMQLDADVQEAQDVSRCSVTGVLRKLDKDDPEMDTIRMRYSIAHQYADQVMDSSRFAFHRLSPEKIYFVGGFGVLAKWIEPEDYLTAAPDILAKDAASILKRINSENGEDLRNLAKHLLDVETEIESIRMTSIDRLGIDIRVTSQLPTRRNKLKTDEFRIGFRIPIMSVEDAKSEVQKVFQEAWEVGHGITWDGDDEVEAPGTSVPIVKIAADSLE